MATKCYKRLIKKLYEKGVKLDKKKQKRRINKNIRRRNEDIPNGCAFKKTKEWYDSYY